MSAPRVAVVIPTYNRAALVVEAVESALAQRDPCHVVVVDDGSTDDTLERLKRFGDSITVVAQENRERGAARNAGAAVVPEADILCFLDADDLLRPDHVSVVSGLALRHPSAPLLATRTRTVDLDLRPLEGSEPPSPGPLTLDDFLLGRQRIAAGTVAIPRPVFDAVGGFDERRELAGSEDWLLKVRLLALGPGARADRVTVLIRKHGGNSMQDAVSMERSMLRAHDVLFRELWPRLRQKPGVGALPENIAERSRARLLLDASTQYYAVGEMGRARELLRKAALFDFGVVTEPRWSWTWARSLLGGRVSRLLRRWKRGRRKEG